MPEVRVAAHEATYLHFDAPIDRASVEVEGRTVRFKWVDVGDTLIVLEPSVNLGAEEKLVVRARYKDGASPATATLALVTRPPAVDKEVSVVRRARTREALETRVAELESNYATLKAQCEDGVLPHLAFSGVLDPSIKARSFQGNTLPGYQGGLEPKRGAGYRAKRWAMVALHVRNRPGQPPWTLNTARLTSKAGNHVKVRSVHMERPQLEPGGDALVVVMVEPPSANEHFFQLDLVDSSGGMHPISNVEF